MRFLARMLVVAALVVALLGAGVWANFAPRSVGALAWSNAVVDSTDARTIRIDADADADAYYASDSGCADWSQRIEVLETAAEVSIGIEGFTQSAPPGTVCPAARTGRVTMQVELDAPLGDRTLRDASDRTVHDVLDVSVLPAVRGLPAGFQDRGVRWDESTGVVDREWRRLEAPAQVFLTIGPVEHVREFDSCDGSTGRAQVGDAPATLCDSSEAEQFDVSVRWSLDGQGITLKAVGDPGTAPSTTDLLDYARSVR